MFLWLSKKDCTTSSMSISWRSSLKGKRLRVVNVFQCLDCIFLLSRISVGENFV